jgi:hypothetical protein
MVETQKTAEKKISREALRDFHITGRGLDQLEPQGPMCPADLEAMELPALAAEYPIYFDLQTAPRALASMLKENAPADRLEAIVSSIANLLKGVGIAAMNAVRQGLLDELRSRVTLSGDEFARLSSAIPVSGWLIPFSADASVLLHTAALMSARRPARERLVAQARHYRDQLQDLMTNAGHGRSAEAVAAALAENHFFDADTLAEALQRPLPGYRLMDPDRRTRILDVLTALDSVVRDAETEPAFWVFDARNKAADFEAMGGRTRHVEHCFAGAMAFCDEQLDRFTRTIRALRTARLETGGAFESAVHGPALERLDWQSADTEELRALPPILIVETADRLASLSLTDFGRVLRSGRPVQIAVVDAGPNTGELNSFVPDFGYLAIAHREAVVLQTSTAAPAHLLKGCEQLAATLRPAVAVTSTPRDESDNGTRWRETSLQYVSRSHPLYSYNPDAGDSWRERFQLVETASADTITFAHTAAVSPALSRHFRVLPANSWTDEQVDIAEYLQQYKAYPPLSIPFLWIASPEGRQRALMTRDLANVCRDRQRAWRILEELAGLRNAYVEAAVAKTRDEVEGMTAARETQLKQDAATEAIYRVVAALTNT